MVHQWRVCWHKAAFAKVKADLLIWWQEVHLQQRELDAVWIGMRAEVGGWHGREGCERMGFQYDKACRLKFSEGPLKQNHACVCDLLAPHLELTAAEG